MKAVWALVLLLPGLAGCATGCQAKSLSGSFSELRLNETTYKINVAGIGFTLSERAGNIALLRAAELTQQAGYNRFVVVSSGTQQNYAGSTSITTNLIGGTVITTGGDPITKPSSDLVTPCSGRPIRDMRPLWMPG